MPPLPLSTPDPISLPQPVADRLLTRASELDATYRARAAVLDLRAAATEAGISGQAFDAAYAELQREAASPPDVPERRPRRSRLWMFGATAIALLAVGALGVSQRMPAGDVHRGGHSRRSSADAPRMIGMPVIEEAIVLRCLAPEDAARLIAPLLDPRGSGVVDFVATAPHVLRIRATPPQLEQVRSVLDAYERGGAASCRVPPTTRQTW